MRIKTYKLSKCFPCFSGHECDRSGRRLPRKKKKAFKKILPFIHFGFMEDVSSCDIGHAYKHHQHWLRWSKFFKKHGDVIIFIKNNWFEFDVEEFVIDIEDGVPTLFWCWEDDNGLYCYGGRMKALYYKDEPDETWSHSETKTFIKKLGLNYKSIESFKDIVEQLDLDKCKYRLENYWNDEE